MPCFVRVELEFQEEVLAALEHESERTDRSISMLVHQCVLTALRNRDLLFAGSDELPLDG